MKITLFDSTAMMDDAQRFLLDLAHGLMRRRWEVSVLLGAAGPLETLLARQGLTVTRLTLPSHGGYWHAIMHVRREFRRQGTQLLCTNSPDAATLGGIAIYLAGGTACWRLHGQERWPQTLLSRVALRLQRQFFVTTTEAGEEVVAHVGRRAPIRVIPPVIDLTPFTATDPPVHRRAEAPVVGMLASWEPCHGQETLVKAVRLLHQGGRAARLHLACPLGAAVDERYRLMVQGVIKAAGLADRILLDGEVSDIPAFLARCNVVVAPFIRPTCGRLALEAAAAGRPLIATHESRVEAITEDGHTGILVPGNDPHALADALALLLASPALRAEMGRQARMRMETQFNLTLLLDALEELLPPEQRQAWMASRGTPNAK